MKTRLLILQAALFAAALAVIGFINGYFLPDTLLNQVMGYMKEALGKIQFGFWGIFMNNLTAALVLFLGGFLLAVPSLVTYYINFLALGAGLHLTVRELGLKFFLVSVAPHGIFEIPAIMAAFVMGISLALAIARKLFLKREIRLADVMRRLGLAFLFIVIPLLAIAAFVEVNVTFQLVQKMRIR